MYQTFQKNMNLKFGMPSVFGAVTENVKLFEDTRIINFDDGSITENTRVGYPIDYIPNTVSSGVGPIPRTIFLF